jgi:hypothetical protein
VTTGPAPVPFWRQLVAGGVGVITAVAGVAGWYFLKRGTSSIWIEIGFVLAPLGLGILVALAIRQGRGAGTFGLAGFAALLTLVADLAGVAVQHRVTVQRLLNRFVARAYDETLAYAKNTAAIRDDARLRQALTNSQVMVVGRIANTVPTRQLKDYWRNRNFIHLNWIAAREIVVLGQGGAERTILEATRIMDNGPFMDSLIAGLAKEPVDDEDLHRFKAQEREFLEKMVDGRITRKEFETSLSAMAWSQITWGSLAFHGANPLVGLVIFAACVTAYQLVREPEETDVI